MEVLPEAIFYHLEEVLSLVILFSPREDHSYLVKKSLAGGPRSTCFASREENPLFLFVDEADL